MDSLGNSHAVDSALDTARTHANAEVCGWGEELDLYLKGKSPFMIV